MMYSAPVGLPGLVAVMAGFACFLVALAIARARRVPVDSGEGRRARRSWLGVVTQGLGIGIGAFGPIDVSMDPTSPQAFAEGVVVAILMAGAVYLFVAATRTMGKNWSLVARTRSDHQLITSGPFAWMRHPIYTAMAMIMVALALAFGHLPQLIFGAPVFAFGTWWRVRYEEMLLRKQFGPHWDAYRTRVKRFIPYIF